MEEYYRRDKLRLEVLESREEKEHFHQDIELLYVLQGTLDVLVEQKTSHMKREDILIINANRQHHLSGSEDVMYVKLTILYDLISDVQGDLNVIFLCDSTENEDESYQGLRRLIQKLLAHYTVTHQETRNFRHISLCYQIMEYICAHFQLTKRQGGSDAETSKYDERIQQINNYIRSNYRSPISLKDLADQMYLSDGYLSRFFKKNYGMSFGEYLTHVRLHHAVDELLYTDIPITRIIYDNGFTSVAIFNKAFKNEYGETPSQVRKRAGGERKAQTPQLSKDTEQRLANVLWTDIPEDESEAGGELGAEVSVLQNRTMHPYWSDCINVGAALDLTRSEVQEHVMILRRALNFRYARFWSPFSKDMLIDMDAPDHHYNFSRLDTVLDFLIGLDMKPFIELSEKPVVLMKSTEKYLFYGIYEEISSLNKWKELLTAFMHHILGRYGAQEVDTWKFELWFDMPRTARLADIQAYLEELKATEEIIHQTTGAEIGGSGVYDLSDGDGRKYSNDFYQVLADSQVQIDFLSVYCYAYDSVLTGASKLLSERSADPDFIVHMIDRMRNSIPAKFCGLPFYITEWNLTVSERNFINDTTFKGAYIIKNYIDMLGKADAMIYFRGTDRVSEYYDTGSFLFGGTGLLTKDGVMKPAAFAFDFLNRLYPYYIGKGSHYIVTTNRADSYGIVCHNCKHLNYSYFHTPEEELDSQHMKQYFDDVDPLTIHLQLKDVANGRYHVKVYRINDRHGSVKYLWEEMGNERELSRGDIEYFRRICEPNLSMQNIEVRDGKADLSLTLEANEIMFVRLRKRPDY